MIKVNENLHTLKEGNRRLSDDKIYKDYREKWKSYPENFTQSKFPLFLDIEATSKCNLRCPYCVQTHANFPRGFIKWDLYKRIIDEASDNHCYGCKYHAIGRGEPLLHHDLLKMIAYAKKKGLIDVYLNTNATLLTYDKAKELLDAGLDTIVFSIEGYTQNIYDKNRVGGNFWQTGWNVQRFKTLRDGGNYKTHIRIQTVNIGNVDLEKYRDFWIVAADEIAFLDYKNMGERVAGLKSDWICPQLWQRMAILYDGEVLPCNHDDRLYAAMGNVKEVSISKLWNSREMNFIREQHKTGNAHMLSACNGCFLRESCIEHLEKRKGQGDGSKES